MSEYKCSPAPWTSQWAIVYDRCCKKVAVLTHRKKGDYTKEDAANATVVKHAPEMLEMLRKLEAALNCNYHRETIEREYGTELRELLDRMSHIKSNMKKGNST